MNKQDSFWLVQKFVMIHDSEFVKPYGEQLVQPEKKQMTAEFFRKVIVVTTIRVPEIFELIER